MLWYWKVGAGAVLFALLTTGYMGWSKHEQNIGHAAAEAEFATVIQLQKDKAAKVLKDETAKVVAHEQALQDLKNKQEVIDHENQKKISKLNNSLRLMSGALHRMRDPHAVPGVNSGPASGAAAPGAGSGGNNGAEASGLLSAELTGLLERITSEADEINAAYGSCRADARAIRVQK